MLGTVPLDFGWQKYVLLRARPIESNSSVMSSESDDITLATQAINGDNKAFTALLQRHDASLRLLVVGLSVPKGAIDDVLQNAYVKAFRALPKFSQKSSFKTWIYRIVYNAAIDELRKTRSEVRIANIDVARSMHSLDDLEGRVVTQTEVIAALSQLPEIQRLSVLLVDAHGFDYSETGKFLNIPTGTVGSHLHLARKKLRAMLIQQGGDNEQ